MFNKRKNKISGISDIGKLPMGVNLIVNLVFITMCILVIYPMLVIVGTSFTTEEYVKTFGYTAFPKEISLFAYEYILKNWETIVRAYGVTIFTTVVGTVTSVLSLALYGYAVSRPEFRYRKFFTFLQFFTMLFGGGLVPWYYVCTQILHLGNTIWALILPSLNSAWNMIILKTFFSTSVPTEMIEAARIDGSSEFRTFFRIVWPVSVPGIATIALFTTLGYWNQYYNAMMLTSSQELQTIQLYLYNILKNLSMLSSGSNMSYQQAGQMLKDLPQESARMALCVVAMGPIVLAYPFFQKYFIKGLTIGSVKG